MNRRFEIHLPDAPLGAEIAGLDLSRDIDADTFKLLEAIYHDRGVICFRGQELTPEQHVRFSRRFGEVEIPTMRQYSLPQQPEIYIVSNIVEDGKNIGNADAGRVWHTDSSYMQTPSRGSLLYALEVPHDESGEPLGDTCFASMSAAYEALAAGTKERIAPLSAVHNYTAQYERRRAKLQAQGIHREALSDEAKGRLVDAIHPVVRPHPLTGIPCIFVNSAFVTEIQGLPEVESLKLRDELIDHSTGPGFVYRHKWKLGDLVVWDNASTQHLAIADYALPQRRLMHRTTVKLPARLAGAPVVQGDLS